MAPLLDVRHLSVHFRTAGALAQAVDDISFHLEPQETLALVGESGCGKTATALALARLQPASALVSGSVLLAGISVFDLPASRLPFFRGRQIGIVFQEPAASFNPIYRLGAQLAEVIRLHHGVGRNAAWAAGLEWLRRVQLSEAERVARQYPHEVSGGMLQRVAIAMALAGKPRLLIADEPTTALDVTLQAEILALLRQLTRELGMALLLITHDLDIVRTAANTVAVMYAGRIVEHGSIGQVLQRPLHPYTAALLACRPRLGQTGRLPSIEGNLPPATQIPAGCRFYERCSFRTEQCRQEPPLEEHSAGHGAACWHSDRLSGLSPT
jgi:oligopeptide/dipeptide ABC transporter ATP-binding protein